jgi:hypothetical protein
MANYGCRCEPCTTANTIDPARRAPQRRQAKDMS